LTIARGDRISTTFWICDAAKGGSAQRNGYDGNSFFGS
jgi:hypothetical protein